MGYRQHPARLARGSDSPPGGAPAGYVAPTLEDLALRLRPPRSPLPELSEGIPLPRGTETILIVEDGPLCRLLAVEILGELGYRVLEASDASEALAIHRRDPHQRIDLLLADVVMENMCGDELAAVMCAERADLKVLLTSGYPRGPPTGHGGQPPLRAPTHFLPKPFTVVELARMVRRVLNGRRAA